MFDILMYLFENYVHSEVEFLVDEDELTQLILGLREIKDDLKEFGVNG